MRYADIITPIVRTVKLERDDPHRHTVSASYEVISGSVIVDLAADQGGNCALTESGRDVVKHGVAILSGILKDQDEDLREVMALYNFTVFEEITQGEWLVLVVEKHGG